MRRAALLLIILIPGIILGSWLAWLWTPSIERNIIIVDKTVVNDRSAEHRALIWTLINERVTHSRGSYDLDRYFGFVPTGGGGFRTRDFARMNTRQREALVDASDVLFIADTYGIFEGTWHEEHTELGPAKRPSRNIYGGLDSADLFVIRRMKESGKLVIAEFNTLGPPTPRVLREEAEILLGVRWTGWVGRQFASLDSAGSELPEWVVGLYTQRHSGVWPFGDRPGIVFTHLDGRITILSYPENLSSPSPLVIPMYDEIDRFGLPMNPVSYPYWFEIVEPDSTMWTVAYFFLPVLPEADSLLRRFDIPVVFPAVLEEKGTQLRYYFAGDFSDYPTVSMATAYFRGSRVLRNAFTSDEDPSSRSEFFWSFYSPLVTRILRKYVPGTVY